MGIQPWDSPKPNKRDNATISTEEGYELDEVVKHFNNKITKDYVVYIIHLLSGNIASSIVSASGNARHYETHQNHSSHNRKEVYEYIRKNLI